MRDVIVLLSLSGERVSIAPIHEVIQSLPTKPEECETEKWLNESNAPRLVDAILRKR